ncbi:MAG: hypothetical protein Q8O99_00370 [bacterium]|nr:hypothetical protein [bacterium]
MFNLYFMSKKPTNHRRPWTPQRSKELSKLAAGNTPTRVIALKLGRTPESIQSRAADL